MATELAVIAQQKQKVEADAARVRNQEAQNWLETTRVDAKRRQVETEAAIIKREKRSIEERDRELRLQEDQRRRNRFVSS